MKTILDIVGGKVAGRVRAQTAPAQCNYADNYYGDQVCVPCRAAAPARTVKP
ncbi:hypothetical protein [Microbulbifer sp. SAOS-129_SWC]|uniref:hypothetical protein n=1 Tax=Microbulbifer sp. SAOS-129_SWC TaxID=3145235 RepID=UPI0032178B9D